MSDNNFEFQLQTKHYLSKSALKFIQRSPNRFATIMFYVLACALVIFSLLACQLEWVESLNFEGRVNSSQTSDTMVYYISPGEANKIRVGQEMEYDLIKINKKFIGKVVILDPITLEDGSKRYKMVTSVEGWDPLNDGLKVSARVIISRPKFFRRLWDTFFMNWKIEQS